MTAISGRYRGEMNGGGGNWKLYPLLFLNACLDFLFTICYFQFFIFSSRVFPPIQTVCHPSSLNQGHSSNSHPIHRSNNNFITVPFDKQLPNRCCTRPRCSHRMMMVMDMEAIPHTIFLIPHIILCSKYLCLFIEKNVIINCVD